MEAESSRFESSEMLASFLASTPFLAKSWAACSYANSAPPWSFVVPPCDEVGYLAFSSVQAIDGSEPTCGTLMALGECGCGEDLFPPLTYDGDGDGEETVKVDAGFLRLFLRFYQRPDFRNQIQEILGKVKMIIVTGHSFGATTATLTALWLLSRLQPAASPTSVLCLTFGAPLLGNASLSRAILRERWGGSFCNVVSKLDLVPRLFFAPLPSLAPQLQLLLQFWQVAAGFPSLGQLIGELRKQNFDEFFGNIKDCVKDAARSGGGAKNGLFWPLGSYLFCSEEGAICLDNAASVVKMMHLMLETISPASSFEDHLKCFEDHLKYGYYTGLLSSQFLKRVNISGLSTSSNEAGVFLALQSSGIDPQVIKLVLKTSSFLNPKQNRAMKSNGGSLGAPRQQTGGSADEITIDIRNDENHSNSILRQEDIDLATSIQKRLHDLPSPSSKCCIFRVPEKLRQGYEVAYMPRVIAIGPYHHNKPHLKRMEDHKLRYLKSFLDHNENFRLEKCIERIRSWENGIRSCYDEAIEPDPNKLVEMTLLDGIFVIQLFLMFKEPRRRLDGDRIFSKPLLLNEIRRDMTLLENQMPFFVIKWLFDMAYGAHQEPLPGLLELAYGFFRPSKGTEEVPEAVMKSEVQHFLDAIRLLYLPTKTERPSESEEKIKFIPSATELVAAGVKLRRGTSERLFDIKFENGMLEIPHLKFYYSTESHFRNIIAFEQCYYQYDHYLIDYMTFMDHLVNTPHDAKLLINKGIIENWLGNENAAADLINTLCKETFQWSSNTYFSSLRGKLDAHCRKPHNKWKATLKRDYCSSPWKVLSIAAAAVLLGLTAVQTACSLLSLK